MKILAVHGYEIFRNSAGQVIIGSLAEAVCQRVAAVHAHYSHILLLGGWHMREVGESPTIAEVMRKRLLALGVSGEKLYTQQELGLLNHMPPRDSMEEVDAVAVMLRKLVTYPRSITIDVACVSYFRPRLWFIYRNRGARIRRFIVPPTSETWDWERIFWQMPTMLLTFLDPKGESRLVVKHRARRTLVQNPGVFAHRFTLEAWQ